MADTTHLLLPLLAAAQAQKHVTHNDALLRLDAITQLAVKDRDLTAPPAAPADGDRYIVAAGATGDWTAWDLNVAWYVDGVWTKIAPREGWRAWVDDENELLVWDGAAWAGVWTAANDGAGSGLDADLLDGTQPTAFGLSLLDDASAAAARTTLGLGTAALEPYESGTFTPTLVGTTTAGSGTYSIQVGKYSKLGNRVDFDIDLFWTAHTGTGDMEIAGLPFVAGAATPAVVNPSSVALTAGNELRVQVLNNDTRIRLLQGPPDGGSSATVPMDTNARVTLSGSCTI